MTWLLFPLFLFRGRFMFWASIIITFVSCVTYSIVEMHAIVFCCLSHRISQLV